MPNISDIIENYILDKMGRNGSIELSRNVLAEYFNCVPSQINYVLATRFTLDRGFSKESKRGGGGYIKISRVLLDDEAKDVIFENVGDELSYNRMMQILKRLKHEKILKEKELNMISSALSNEALSIAENMDFVRANAFKCVLVSLMKEER